MLIMIKLAFMLHQAAMAISSAHRLVTTKPSFKFAES